MNILTVDQAREGAWSVFDYEKKEPVAYGTFSFPTDKSTFAKALVGICDLVEKVVVEHDVAAVFIEDIQLRQNVDSFKKLAQLQGSLISMFERNEYLYDFIPPSTWQSYCNARGRTSKEIKARLKSAEEVADATGKKQSKVLSVQYVKERFGIETDNDNLADAIAMSDYVVNNVKIRTCEDKENNNG